MRLNPMPLGEVQRRTSTLQRPRRETMTNLVCMVGRVTYTDPTTARLVVDDFRAIPLIGERQADQARACRLKITKLNSLHQSLMARQMRREPEAIRAALAPASRAAVCHIRPLTHWEARGARPPPVPRFPRS